GVPIAIDVQMLNADIEITDQQPRLVESPGDQVSIRLTFDGDVPGKMASLVVYARRAFDDAPSVSEPFVVPPAARLRFAIGFDQTEWLPGTQGATFKCSLLRDRGAVVLFEARLRPETDPEQRIWLDSEIDLGAYAGENVRIEFEGTGVVSG